MICSNCNNARQGGFTVIHYGSKNEERLRVDLCTCRA